MSSDLNTPLRVSENVLRVEADNRADKVEVVFSSGPTVLVKLGETLLRVAEANQVPLESGCRMGLCGADPVRILAGAENLSPPSGGERATLRRVGLPPDCRMACVARVRGAVCVSPTVERGASPSSPPAPPFVPKVGTRELTCDVRRVVVIGNGAAGTTAAVELRERHSEAEITVLGAEPYDFYNRMIVHELVTESLAINQLYLLPRDWADSRRVRYLRGVSARSINRTRQEVLTDEGEVLSYDRLILATGARCFVPSIEGVGLRGSFVLRTIDDAVQLQQHIRGRRCRSAVIIGGGLLGLEAAFCISKLGVRVFVLDRAPWPLSRQLDQPAGALLAQLMNDLGIRVVSQTQARQIVGSEWVEGVILSNGQQIKAELCLVATGITPDVSLAQAAGLTIDRGIVVDAHMQTSDPHVYAVGDAASYQGQVFGLWTAAVDQAHIAVENLLGGNVQYNGTVPPTKLKVAGIDVHSVGEINAGGEAGQDLRVDDGGVRKYRKLVLREGRVCGGVLIGHPDLHDVVSEAVKSRIDVRDQLGDLERGTWSVLAAR